MSNTFCPQFCVGNCNVFNCDYNHVKCKHGIICNKENCEFGHPIRYENRIIINDMYMKNCTIQPEKENTIKTFCKFNVTCNNKNCKFMHPFSYDSRNIMINNFKKIFLL